MHSFIHSFVKHSFYNLTETNFGPLSFLVLINLISAALCVCCYSRTQVWYYSYSHREEPVASPLLRPPGCTHRLGSGAPHYPHASAPALQRSRSQTAAHAAPEPRLLLMQLQSPGLNLLTLSFRGGSQTQIKDSARLGSPSKKPHQDKTRYPHCPILC